MKSIVGTPNCHRVVVTGMGAQTPIGSDLETIGKNLWEGNSGIAFSQEMADADFRSQVAGIAVHPNKMELAEKVAQWQNSSNSRQISKYLSRSAGIESLYGIAAGISALVQAEINYAQDSDLALLAGVGGSNTQMVCNVGELIRTHEKGKIYKVPFAAGIAAQTMASTVAANLTTVLGIKQAFPSVSSACATGIHAIGEAAVNIATGRVNRVLAGGMEGFYLPTTAAFDFPHILASNFNDQPQKASRPYDKDRGGFVIGSGAGMLVLENLETARARGAKIYAEIAGYAINSDGKMDMTNADPESMAKCIQSALANTPPALIDYINTHGTGTSEGDPRELLALAKVFGGVEGVPHLSSTKSWTGHMLGAAGAAEAIFSILAMQGNFVPPSGNIENLDPKINPKFKIVQQTMRQQINYVLTTNFGFGGTNGALVLKKFNP